MIKVAINNDSQFNEIMTSLDTYSVYTELFTDKKIPNPFVRDPAGVPVFSYYQIEEIQQCSAKTIIVNVLEEGYHVCPILKQYPKDKFYILCSSGWWNPTVDLGFKYYLLHWYYFLYYYREKSASHHNIESFLDKEYKFELTKPYLFCSLIGHKRHWRDLLIPKIQNGIVNKNHILNYDGVEYGVSSRSLDVKYDFSQFHNVGPIHNYFTISHSIPIKLYNSCRLNLIVESVQWDENDEFFLTEKTVKALITGMPFVIYGSYKFLSRLRELGFKTYNDVWSEDYDDLVGASARADAIVKLLNELDQFDWNEKVNKKLQEIADHNKLVIMNADSIMKKQITKIVQDLSQITYEI